MSSPPDVSGETLPRRSHPPVPTDEELDRYVLTRLALIGVDLSVLPRRDPAAPVDLERVLCSARWLLREVVPALSGYDLLPPGLPPTLYPAQLPPVRTRAQATGRNDTGGSSGSPPPRREPAP
jgi:hypothetical protein